LGYTLDVYRGETHAEKNPAKYALFVSFFPQLVAGPIERSKNLLAQIHEQHYFDYDRIKNPRGRAAGYFFCRGNFLYVWGLLP
jgi:D-alanyl-lipoteichoic acid acyltransferase DltB (MBOAT superfamily)